MANRFIYFNLINLAACTDSNELVGEKPPKVLVEIDNESYETKLGTYCWSGKNVKTCVDSAGPVGLLENKKPIEAQPGEKVTIKMDYEPKPTEIHVTQFDANENNKETEVPLSDNQYTVPKEKGTYYYAYSTGWTDKKDAHLSKGDALYAFVLKVN